MCSTRVGSPPSVGFFIRQNEGDRRVLHGAVRCERFERFVAHAITHAEVDQMNDGLRASDGCMNGRYPRVHEVETLQDLPCMADAQIGRSVRTAEKYSSSVQQRH